MNTKILKALKQFIRWAFYSIAFFFLINILVLDIDFTDNTIRTYYEFLLAHLLISIITCMFMILLYVAVTILEFICLSIYILIQHWRNK